MLKDMTQAKWNALTHEQREAIRDMSGLSAHLRGLEGFRVEVVRKEINGGGKARFIVGRSTGWRPCHLEIARRTSSGGRAADREYQSVRKLYFANRSRGSL